MKKKIIASFIAAGIMSASVASAGQVTTHAEMPGKTDYIYCMETYKADSLKAESLDDIVDYYLTKNTYGERAHEEFKEGILEVNPWLCDRKKEHGQIMVGAGEEIVVYYWKKK